MEQKLNLREALCELDNTSAKFHDFGMRLEFGEMLTKYVQKEGISHSELGRRLGLNKGYVSRLFKCCENLTVETMAKISLKLGFKPILKFEEIEL